LLRDAADHRGRITLSARTVTNGAERLQNACLFAFNSLLLQWGMRPVFSLGVLIAFAGIVSAETQATATINQYCIACHSSTAKVADLALDALDAENPGQQPEVWESVVKKLTHRHMPPIGMPRPDEATYDKVVSELTAAIDKQAAAEPKPGRTATFRRLNRAEYRNAVRELLDVDVDVSSMLPRDESSLGFDNITVGELSPTLLERYLSAARKISRLAIGSPVSSPGGQMVVLPADLTQEGHFRDLPFGTRGGTVAKHTFPRDAEYEIQITLSRNRDEQIEGLLGRHELDLLVDGKHIKRFWVDKPDSRDHTQADKHLNVRVPVTAGPHEVAVTFLRKNSALIETTRQPYMARFNMDRHPRTQPAIYSVSVVGPYNATGPGDTPSRRRIFTCSPSAKSAEDACAKKILGALLRRAYRRPVTDSDIEKPFGFYEQGKAADGFENGIEMAVRAILVSPRFLFRIERDPAGAAKNQAYKVSDIELASRLSFFLWSSIPDDELLSAAESGELRKPAVLEKQVRRMLVDQRSQALVDNFAAQWLYLRNLESVSPDRRLYPDFDDNLRQAFRRETEMLFESIVREDRGVVDLLTADYTFLNERLAKHYGIPHIYGDHFRRIELGANSPRGGLLGQGSILAVTSYANRTSPVVRGKWVLTNILGTPPDPPAPDVPPLTEKTPNGKKLTLRERISEHRANPVCASCHDIMDPVGFALENYDAIGRWRTQDDGLPVDPSGTLPDGTKFSSATEFRAALVRRPELFVSTATEKLLTYALGRGLEAYDAPAIRKIVSDGTKDDFHFSSLILGIVNSTPFQMRTAQ
jgi:hypothetical protein